MHYSIPSVTPTQIRHCHNLHHQTRPAREMLRSLASARFRVILLPREARSFPFVEDVFDKIFPERGVNVDGLRFVVARLNCDVLHIVSGILLAYLEVSVGTYVETFHGEVVHVHPYRTSPVILVCFIEFIALAQTP